MAKKIAKPKKAKGKRHKLYADSDDSSADETKPTCKVPSTTSRLPKHSQPPARSSNSESDEDEAHSELDSRAGKLGRPRGRARPRVINFNHPKAIKAVNFRRDNVDEEAARLGVIYQRWKNEFGHITNHVSVRDFNDVQYSTLNRVERVERCRHQYI